MKITYREALNQAMCEEMARDDRVFLMGEEVAEYNGAYKVSQGMLEKFGSKRVIDTPITELGFAGLGVGAAMTGLRPIIEFMTWNFAILALDQIVNAAAKMQYMSGGQYKVPMVFRGAGGSAARVGAQHSQSLENWLANVPGLKVVMPSCPADAKGLLKASIRDNDPVVFIENEINYGDVGTVPEGEYIIPLGKADIKRAGKDVTIVAHSRMTGFALAAAVELAKQGIDAEIIDPRTIRPLDETTILRSVAKTNRVVTVEEGWRFAGIGAEISARIMEKGFDDLDGPVIRVTGKEVPMAYAANLEAMTLPSVADIVEAARVACGKA
ncbi:MAG: pyruvate dehydrogenase complex E1 component subunit beta [Zetaproteobacteria bacterium CG12_big_fil_rev_8_21_14_0_65_54_13]|nr:MAG: pyruvate dehydrogenase complex E1 component subunit beta [Zetaproteobacteria bacterium CG12_big_fil_rev_8_21_14_0_65_54_13]PIX54526.1 MAG: pyruvate dehydrogenase complex E1 component subunit beta [Zetaproteobacteria bacterium CG_4_10_14_3_um_filter_54_28]PJA28700.1 MAG: pyruvate dehydrogenase complex E1 component subunit beta [Zetaproteobacteria bacterium CG_4_9_14_3_um_filter_54_145]